MVGKVAYRVCGDAHQPYYDEVARCDSSIGGPHLIQRRLAAADWTRDERLQAERGKDGQGRFRFDGS